MYPQCLQFAAADASQHIFYSLKFCIPALQAAPASFPMLSAQMVLKRQKQLQMGQVVNRALLEALSREHRHRISLASSSPLRDCRAVATVRMSARHMQAYADSLPQVYLVMVHKVEELCGADLGEEVLVSGNLDDSVQVRLLFLLLLLLLLCLLSLQRDTCAVINRLII